MKTIISDTVRNGYRFTVEKSGGRTTWKVDGKRVSRSEYASLLILAG